MFRRSRVVLMMVLGCHKQVIVTRPVTQAPNTVAISGRAYLIAPIVGAHVRATALSRIPPAVVADGLTDTGGSFTLTVTGIDGDFLVEVLGDQGGGTTIEPMTGIEPIPLSQDDRLAAIAIGTTLGGAATLQINPWSTLVAVRSQTDAASLNMSVADAFSKNVALFSAHFGTASPWEASPVDLVSSPSPGLSSSTIYSLSVLALSDHALALGARAGTTDVSVVNTLSVLRLLVADQSNDTFFDGKSADAILPAVAGNVHIDTETTRVSLASALEDFLLSPKNASGLSSRDVQNLLNAMRFDNSELYPNAASTSNPDPTAASGAGPALSVTVPVQAQTLGATDSITASIHDADGLATASLSIDGTDIAAAFVQLSGTDWGLSYLPPTIADGAHVLELDASDALGNSSSSVVNFLVDRSPPTIAFVSCTAPDDSQRTVSVSSSAATYAATTVLGDCTEAALGASNGSQTFNSFGALLGANGALVPTIALAIADASGLSAVTCEPLLNGKSLATALPCSAAPSAPATHMLTVAQSFFGAALLTVSKSDALSIRVRAVDAEGNTSTRDFVFHVAVLPTPLFFQQHAADPAHDINSLAFAYGNVERIFDPNTGYLELGRYLVRNVSGVPTVLSVTSGVFSNNAGAFVADYFHGFRTNFNKLRINNGSSGVACAPLTAGYVNYETFSPLSCGVAMNSSILSREQDGVAVWTTVSDITAGTQLPVNQDATLLPQHDYVVVIEAPTGALPAFGMEANPANDSIGQACAAYVVGEGSHEQIVATEAALQINGFTKPTVFWNDGSNDHAFYGYMSCNSMRVGNAGVSQTPVNATTGEIPTLPSYPYGEFAYLLGNPANDGTEYIYGDIYLERRVTFRTNATWTPQIHLVTSAASRAAKSDNTALSFLTNYVTNASQPDLSPSPQAAKGQFYYVDNGAW